MLFVDTLELHDITELLSRTCRGVTPGPLCAASIQQDATLTSPLPLVCCGDDV